MTTKNRAPKHVIERLRELRKHASLENASFGFAKAAIMTGPDAGEPMPIDELIKEKTRLHRNT